jgi:hypothetical protein
MQENMARIEASIGTEVNIFSPYKFLMDLIEKQHRNRNGGRTKSLE